MATSYRPNDKIRSETLHINPAFVEDQEKDPSFRSGQQQFGRKRARNPTSSGKCIIICGRIFLAILSVLLLLAGIFCIGACIAIQRFHQRVEHKEILMEAELLEPELYAAASMTLLCLGITSVAGGILGLVGSIKLDSVLLRTYAVFQMPSIVVNIVCAIYLVHFYPQKYENDKIMENLKQQISYRYNVTANNILPADGLTNAWNKLQKEYKCCGVYDYKDFLSSAWYNNSHDAAGQFVPESCCDINDFGKRSLIECQVSALALLAKESTAGRGNLQPLGCYVLLSPYLWPQLHVYLTTRLSCGIMTVLCLPQIISLVVCCHLIRKTQK